MPKRRTTREPTQIPTNFFQFQDWILLAWRRRQQKTTVRHIYQSVFSPVFSHHFASILNVETEMSSTTKGKKSGRSAIADVVSREYTIHLHKRVCWSFLSIRTSWPYRPCDRYLQSVLFPSALSPIVEAINCRCRFFIYFDPSLEAVSPKIEYGFEGRSGGIRHLQMRYVSLDDGRRTFLFHSLPFHEEIEHPFSKLVWWSPPLWPGCFPCSSPLYYP